MLVHHVYGISKLNYAKFHNVQIIHKQIALTQNNRQEINISYAIGNGVVIKFHLDNVKISLNVKTLNFQIQQRQYKNA